jgi:hypothetical protein
MEESEKFGMSVDMRSGIIESEFGTRPRKNRLVTGGKRSEPIRNSR